MTIRAWKIGASAVAFASLMAGGQALAADYFAGKTITVQVPSGSGGTYHVYCQLVQRHIASHIPGNPSTLIQNMPGGGGAKSAAYMMNVAPKNGTYIAMIAPGTITVPLWRKVKFDARKYNWLGSVAARSGAIWAWHTHGITTLKQLKEKEVTVASTGFASAGSVWPRLVNRFLHTKMKLIYGYKGGGALNVAVERGETMARWNYRSGFTGVRPSWLPEKKVVPIIAMGPRDPAMAGIPYMRDLLKEGSIEQKVYDVIGMNFEVGQAFYTTPGVPKKAVATLMKAFDDMLKDPKLKEDIVKRRVEYSPKTSVEVVAEINKGFKAATPDVVKAIKAVYKKKKKS